MKNIKTIISLMLAIAMSACTYENSNILVDGCGNPIITDNLISGKWFGTLIQPSGGLSKNYNFSLDIICENGVITGTSRIEIINSPNYGVMALSGTLTSITCN